ncbi:glycosyltransferase [Nonlabens tegetincola]|uniref:Glycosyltransferase n=1 Tax=Nonlabens tegetincola TaxID=323273 RepID=A0A090QNJ5_9FLAO|nr:glycosyltransferase family 2 protein [Nonlabens tegetincola]GAK97056.1 glycosyltransferase [Nonlabens tegetincola]
MKIAIAILNWNGLSLLKEYLPEVVKYSNEHPIYIIDNASTDDSVQWIKSHYENKVEIIILDQNYGYSGGYNRGIDKIKEEWICLLNSDVRVTENWLEPITNAIERYPKLAACQPKILDDKQKELFEYAGAAGGFLDRFGYPYCRGRVFDTIEQDYGQYDTVVDIDWASGACLFVNKTVFTAAGRLDEDFFAHQEEIDLCWRIKLLDKEIKVIPSSQVYHKGGATLSYTNPKKTYLNFRNSLFVQVKNNHHSLWLLHLFIRMVLDGLAAFKLWSDYGFTFFVAVLKAHKDFYLSLGKFVNKRKAIKKQSVVENVSLTSFSVVFKYYFWKKTRYQDL